MSLTQALNTALAGLNATQAGLSVISGNVANANTPGYIDKSVILRGANRRAQRRAGARTKPQFHDRQHSTAAHSNRAGHLQRNYAGQSGPADDRGNQSTAGIIRAPGRR